MHKTIGFLLVIFAVAVQPLLGIFRPPKLNGAKVIEEIKVPVAPAQIPKLEDEELKIAESSVRLRKNWELVHTRTWAGSCLYLDASSATQE